MIYTVFAYIKFLLRSKNHHAVHSPFVFNFITKCVYDKATYDTYEQLSRYRSQLLSSTKSITVEDFGSGSKKLGNTRLVKQMAHISGSTLKKAKLLYRISNYFNLKYTLELGTHLGLGTQALALQPNNSVTTIEGCHNTYSFTKSQLKLKNIVFAQGKFLDILPNLAHQKFDCVFFDGNHNKAATLNYFNMLKASSHNDSIFIFDDIYWSKEMTDAWNTIVNDPSISVSVDCFHFGFAFFRKEQGKEHFVIRL